MSHKKTGHVNIQQLKLLFNEFGIWEKIRDKTLTTIPLAPRPSTTYEGGISRILLHFDAKGKHVASTHRIMNERTGAIFHWDEKGIQFDDVWLERY